MAAASLGVAACFGVEAVSRVRWDYSLESKRVVPIAFTSQWIYLTDTSAHTVGGSLDILLGNAF